MHLSGWSAPTVKSGNGSGDTRLFSAGGYRGDDLMARQGGGRGNREQTSARAEEGGRSLESLWGPSGNRYVSLPDGPLGMAASPAGSSPLPCNGNVLRFLRSVRRYPTRLVTTR